jgi:hypothetical protein
MHASGTGGSHTAFVALDSRPCVLHVCRLALDGHRIMLHSWSINQPRLRITRAETVTVTKAER